MAKSKSETIIEFTRKILTVNTAYRQFLQCTLKAHKMGLTFEMLQVMGCLWKKDGINQQEITYITVKDKASMTYLIDNLAKRNLVKRQEDPSDRRNKLIMLTDQGKLLKNKIQPYIDEMYQVAGKNIEIDLLNQCMEVLSKVENNLNRKLK
ncbi:MAG TPA: MarR family transcriptional regulator [Puia sp.]|nr:MarR family transcriptional regulator [Puia sp.]